MVDFLETKGYDQDFFGCLSDPVLCIATTCFAPLVVGKVQGDIDGGGFNIFSCLCAGVGAYRLRRHVQRLAGIQESEDSSMMAVGLLGCCAVNQDVHELTKRGVIPSLTGGPPPQSQQMQGTPQMMQPQQPDPVYHA